jgi:hypothetical protein
MVKELAPQSRDGAYKRPGYTFRTSDTVGMVRAMQVAGPGLGMHPHAEWLYHTCLQVVKGHDSQLSARHSRSNQEGRVQPCVPSRFHQPGT